MRDVRVLLACVGILLFECGFGFCRSSFGDEPYSPEHPVVQAMVKKGVDFLSSNFARSRTTHEYDILMGYTAYKATEDYNHPLVKKAIPFALKTAKEIREKSGALQGEHIVYDVSISAMLLASVDGAKYKSELEYFRDFLKSIQRDTGGFGYLNMRQGSSDASQTQYVTLALWTMKQANVDIDFKSVERVSAWLQNAQRPDGGWTYQTPSSGDVPNHQMLAAGLSAALISGDILGVMRGPGMKLENALEGEEGEEEEIPEVFRRVSAEALAGKKEKKFVSQVVSRDSLRKISTKAASWLSQNKFKRGAGGSDWFYYWLYSQERYESFLEILNGRREKDPDWYRQGVETLKKYQDPATGAFGLTGESVDPGGVEQATCLSILFLLRTTQKAIGDLKEMTNLGGQGGLANVADVTAVNGKVVDKSQVTNVEDMLKMLENSKGDASDDKLLADRIPLESDPKARKEQLNRFSRMLRSPSFAARRLAAKILGRGDDLDYVPDLIYALSDEDPVVPLVAENSLRILSRQMTNSAIPKDRTITADDRVKAERRWQQWYLSVRPDYRFISN